MRQNAANWLELADKVWNFRRDVLTAAESEALLGRRGALRQLLAEKADAGRLKLGIESLEESLRLCGGAIYPKTSLTENVEFFLVAAIVILGIRTYFVQPFKIPTNSMWPTYYGMTAENLPASAPAPGLPERIFRLFAYGAQRHEAIAPRSGTVEAAFFGNRRLAYTLKSGRSWLIFPTKVKEYTFYVDGTPVSVRVPEDFSGLDSSSEGPGILAQTFFADEAAFETYWDEQVRSGRFQTREVQVDEANGTFVRALVLPLPRPVRAGQPVVRFDVLTGDQLFVDRVSYHFMRPRVGQGFVFRTDHIPDIERAFGDQYFIKRLIGVPGDTVEIREPMIYRNGAPIGGSKAFDLNAGRVSPYRGYFNMTADPRYAQSQLFKGDTITVPARGYLALGDNSKNSFDGRFWGFVPEKDVIGRPLFIYYPFTRRWGTAR